MKERGYDVVVAGAGSAGCALAARLVDRGLRVCLVEAGPDYGPLAQGRWPRELLDPRQRPRTHDWGYAEPRGRVIGGSSAYNQCAAIWPVPDDFDRWPGWTYADVMPLIDRVERDLSAEFDPYRGHRGAVPTVPYPDDGLALWHRAFLQAAEEAGYPRVHDLSAPEPASGIVAFHANVLNHVRWNSAFAFLDAVRGRPNLTVLADTLADRLVIRGNRAVELIGTRRGESVRIAADRFVLSGGTFGSPAILLRSGIGPAPDLSRLGISVSLDLPGVGRNLHDHPGVRLEFQPNDQTRRALEKEFQAGRFYQSQVNLRARTFHAAGSFDLHIDSHQSRSSDGWSEGLFVYHLAPLSRGRLTLRGREPELAPDIDFQFLSDPEGRDLRTLLEAVPIARQVASQSALAQLVDGESHPGTAVQDGDGLAGFIRTTVSGYSHPAGTCRTGPQDDVEAVVDSRGRVWGMENLFVADASIIPVLPRANINLLCFLIGRRIADLM